MENQKTKIISIVAIVALAFTVVTATYAYFQAQTGEGSQTDIKINANTVDTFTFETGSAINLSLDQTSFASGSGNITGNTYASAKLTANNKTNTATEHYYLYLNISDNTFTYTQGETKPEILLTIKDASNNEMTSINGLEYKTVTDGNGTIVKGFDITTKDGLIALLDNREITTTSSKEEKWNVTITFVNYDASQNANAGKSMTAKVVIQNKSLTKTLADYVISQYNGVQGNNNIYYHDSSLTNGAGDNSYRYAGSSDTTNNYVCFGSDAATCPEDNLYRIIGVFDGKVKLIKATAATSSLLGTDGGYVNGSTYKWSNLDSCPSETAHVQNNKLIMLSNKNILSMPALEGCNEWKNSELNKTNLNKNFINNIGDFWANLINENIWKVSGHTTTSVTAKEMFTAEITNAVTTHGPSKIGLMYVSDYMYAMSKDNWILTNPTISTENWLYSNFGKLEWSISPFSESSAHVFILTNVITYDSTYYGEVVRPVFYLTDSAIYLSGDGTRNSPIRIS